MASGAGKVSTVRLLLSLGADVTHRNALHRTAQDLAKDPATAEIFTGTAAPMASCVCLCLTNLHTTSRGQVPVAHPLLKLIRVL
jgi:hypothetical protein